MKYMIEPIGAQFSNKDVAKLSGVARARPIMADDHYGWFERVSTGIYGLTPKGAAAVAAYAGEIDNLARAAA